MYFVWPQNVNTEKLEDTNFIPKFPNKNITHV